MPSLTIAEAEPFADSGRGQSPAGSGSCARWWDRVRDPEHPPDPTVNAGQKWERRPASQHAGGCSGSCRDTPSPSFLPPFLVNGLKAEGWASGSLGFSVRSAARKDSRSNVGREAEAVRRLLLRVPVARGEQRASPPPAGSARHGLGFQRRQRGRVPALPRKNRGQGSNANASGVG